MGLWREGSGRSFGCLDISVGEREPGDEERERKRGGGGERERTHEHQVRGNGCEFGSARRLSSSWTGSKETGSKLKSRSGHRGMLISNNWIF